MSEKRESYLTEVTSIRDDIESITKEEQKQIRKWSGEVIDQIGLTSDEIKSVKKRGNQKIEDLVRNFLICYDIIEALVLHPEISQVLTDKLKSVLRKLYYKKDLQNFLLELDYSEEKDRQLEGMQDAIRLDLANLTYFISFVLMSTQVLSTSGRGIQFGTFDDQEELPI